MKKLIDLDFFIEKGRKGGRKSRDNALARDPLFFKKKGKEMVEKRWADYRKKKADKK